MSKLDDYDASFDMDPNELMSPVITTDTGIRMAQPRGPIVVTWTMQVCAIICTFLFVGAACIKMQFVLVPLILVRTHRTLPAPPWCTRRGSCHRWPEKQPLPRDDSLCPTELPSHERLSQG